MKIIFHRISVRLSNHRDVIIEANRDFQSLKSTAKSISSSPRLPSESNAEDYSSTHERPQKKVSADWYRAFRFASGSYERRSSLSQVVRQQLEGTRKIATAQLFNPRPPPSSNNILSMFSCSRRRSRVDRIIFSRCCRVRASVYILT